MNKVIRFPPQLRLAPDGLPAEMDRLTPLYAAFCRSMRRARTDWLALVESDELADTDLVEEAGVQGGALRQILEVLRPGSIVRGSDQTSSEG